MRSPAPSSGGAEPALLLAGSATGVAALVVALTALRLWAGGALGLTADEAYYLLWSRHLAFGYFDHPPMVALFIRVSTSLFGEGPFGIRALSALAAAGASVGAYVLARQLALSRGWALAAAGFVQASLFLGVGAIIVTPDTPLVLFWFSTLVAVMAIAHGGPGWLWLVAGVLVGLSFQSKYSAVFLGFGLAVTMLWSPPLRRWFFSPWPYAGGLLCLAVMTPVIWWNMAHGGVSFARQFGRAVPTAFDPRFVPEFIAGQAGLLTPLVAIVVLFGLVSTIREALRERAAGPTLLVATTLPLMLYLVWYGMFDRVQGNWTACLWPASAAMAVLAMSRGLPGGQLGGLLAFSWRWSLVTGIALSLVVMAHAAFRIVPLEIDPTSQIGGWPEAAMEVERVAIDRGAGTIGTLTYTMTAHLAASGSGRPPVMQLNERIRWVQEGEPDARPLRQRPILVVVEARRAAAAEAVLREAFGRVLPAGEVARRWRGMLADRILLFEAAEPRGEGFPAVRSLF